MTAPSEGFRVIGARKLVSSGWMTVERQYLTTPDGATLRREIVRHPGAVAVVPVVGDEVVLIRQFRAPTDGDVLEIPAGKLDVEGEGRESTAHRELEEEIGYRPGTLRELCSFWTGPGFTDEYMWVYLATQLEPADRAPAGPEEHHAEILHVPFDDAVGMIFDGRIRDAKTIAGLLAADRLRPWT